MVYSFQNRKKRKHTQHCRNFKTLNLVCEIAVTDGHLSVCHCSLPFVSIFVSSWEWDLIRLIAENAVIFKSLGTHCEGLHRGPKIFTYMMTMMMMMMMMPLYCILSLYRWQIVPICAIIINRTCLCFFSCFLKRYVSVRPRPVTLWLRKTENEPPVWVWSIEQNARMWLYCKFKHAQWVGYRITCIVNAVSLCLCCYVSPYRGAKTLWLLVIT